MADYPSKKVLLAREGTGDSERVALGEGLADTKKGDS